MAPTEASALMLRQGTTTERYAVTTAAGETDRPRTARSMVDGPMGITRACMEPNAAHSRDTASDRGAIPGSPRGADAP